SACFLNHHIAVRGFIRRCPAQLKAGPLHSDDEVSRWCGREVCKGLLCIEIVSADRECDLVLRDRTLTITFATQFLRSIKLSACTMDPIGSGFLKPHDIFGGPCAFELFNLDLACE